MFVVDGWEQILNANTTVIDMAKPEAATIIALELTGSPRITGKFSMGV